MARSRGVGDERMGRGQTGQQSGSSRPQRNAGAARPAPKKGDLPPKGTARMGAAQRSQPSKGGGMERKR